MAVVSFTGLDLDQFCDLIRDLEDELEAAQAFELGPLGVISPKLNRLILEIVSRGQSACGNYPDFSQCIQLQTVEVTLAAI